jgi:hypothetical protein
MAARATTAVSKILIIELIKNFMPNSTPLTLKYRVDSIEFDAKENLIETEWLYETTLNCKSCKRKNTHLSRCQKRSVSLDKKSGSPTIIKLTLVSADATCDGQSWSVGDRYRCNQKLEEIKSKINQPTQVNKGNSNLPGEWDLEPIMEKAMSAEEKKRECRLLTARCCKDYKPGIPEYWKNPGVTPQEFGIQLPGNFGVCPVTESLLPDYPKQKDVNPPGIKIRLTAQGGGKEITENRNLSF